ncbi:hypothetical protein HID58_069232 [Brassica napus]|uniref:AMP-dependent synthetase/ligase domain-containing protein n=1 Tax=Brassica napus TaxID=3708 RepID=A0ABQ7XET1_BRANA|nr:hypothetical protein HID58_069232 [Brassica napus]
MEGTMKSTANYVPLTPISFLDRSAVVYADRTSVVYGPVTYTWRQTRDRCVRVASALSQLGISSGDVVRTFSLPLCAYASLETLFVLRRSFLI